MKYNSQFTDLDALQRELGTSDPGSRAPVDDAEAEDDGYEDWTGTDH